MTQQNSTKSNNIGSINPQTGLTPQQEKAVSLLVAGKNYTQVANELKIDRSTLYTWNEKITFKAYFNKLCKEVQDEVKNSLTAMYNDAVKAVEDSLRHDNPTIRFKAASWLIEKLQSQQIGITNPYDIISQMATRPSWPEIPMEELDTVTYRRLCLENNLEP